MLKETIQLQQITVSNATQRTISVIGGKGTGKTTLLKMLLKDRHSTLVLDPLNVINSKVIDAYRMSLSSATNDEQAKKIAKVAGHMLSQKKNVVISFVDMLREEEQYFIDLMLPLIRWKDGYIFIDEIHEFVPIHGGSVEVHRFIRHCRNQNIGAIITTQRPASVHKDVLALTDYLILFRLTWTHDVVAIKDLLSHVVDKEGLKPILAELPRLGFMEGFIIDYRRTEDNYESGRDTNTGKTNGTPGSPPTDEPGDIEKVIEERKG